MTTVKTSPRSDGERREIWLIQEISEISYDAAPNFTQRPPCLYPYPKYDVSVLSNDLNEKIEQGLQDSYLAGLIALTSCSAITFGDRSYLITRLQLKRLPIQDVFLEQDEPDYFKRFVYQAYLHEKGCWSNYIISHRTEFPALEEIREALARQSKFKWEEENTSTLRVWNASASAHMTAIRALVFASTPNRCEDFMTEFSDMMEAAGWRPRYQPPYVPVACTVTFTDSVEEPYHLLFGGPSFSAFVRGSVWGTLSSFKLLIQPSDDLSATLRYYWDSLEKQKELDRTETPSQFIEEIPHSSPQLYCLLLTMLNLSATLNDILGYREALDTIQEWTKNTEARFPREADKRGLNYLQRLYEVVNDIRGLLNEQLNDWWKAVRSSDKVLAQGVASTTDIPPYAKEVIGKIKREYDLVESLSKDIDERLGRLLTQVDSKREHLAIYERIGRLVNQTYETREALKARIVELDSKLNLSENQIEDLVAQVKQLAETLPATRKQDKKSILDFMGRLASGGATLSGVLDLLNVILLSAGYPPVVTIGNSIVQGIRQIFNL